MINIDADEPLGEAGEAEWERLRKQIEFASGFWLGFVFSPSPMHVLVLRARVTRLLAAERATVLVYRPEQPEELRSVLQRLLQEAQPPAGCTWVEAVRSDSSGARQQPWTDAWNDLFLRMNERRDALRARLTGGLVFAGPPELKPRIREAAPDLWSVRAMVIDLKTGAPTEIYDPLTIVPDAEGLSAGTVEHEVMAPGLPPDASFALEEAKRREARHAVRPQALALMQAAEGFLAEGRTKEAREAALQARDLLRGGGSYDEAQALALLARAESAGGEPRAAMKHISGALDHWRALGIGRAPLDWCVLAGDLAVGDGNLVEASRMYAEAEAIAREGVRRGANAEALQDLSIVLRRIGGLRRQSGNLPAAGAAYDEALDLARALRERQGETPAALSAMEGSLYNLGTLRASTGEITAAIAAFEEAMAFGRRKLALIGETPAALINFAATLGRLAEMRRASGDFPGTVAALEERADVARRLIELHGSSASHRGLLFRTRRSLAALRQGQGDDAGASVVNEENTWQMIDRHGPSAFSTATASSPPAPWPARGRSTTG
jgi:tetratricopeptide (TPR) repeat protein